MPGEGRPNRILGVRIGVIHNGLHAEAAFNSRRNASLIRTIRQIPFVIFAYDVLIILTHTDQALLQRLRPLLNLYLRLGGVLVILGATMYSRRWFPLCNWEQKFPESIQFDSTTEDGRRIQRG